jgi:phycoerythrin-associated linker protein
MVSTAPAVKFGIDAFSETRFELWPGSSSDDKATVMNAAYRQVLGNAHVMESERLVSAESYLCNGQFSVREFVRALAKSDFYRSRFFSTSAPYRFVELNFKHLLGRAPASQAEVAQHIRRCVEEGYDAEIDSYIDSDEYQASFGEDTVPFYRGIRSQVGQNQAVYNRTFAIFRGPAESDKAVKASQLVAAIAGNSATKIKPPSSGGIGSAPSAPGKRFKIVVTGMTNGSRRRLASKTYLVQGDNMTQQLKQIHRTSGKVVSITEV